MNPKELNQKLENLSGDQIAWFSARCALRVVPVLAYKGEDFFFWRNDAKAQAFAVFRALNASIALSARTFMTIADIGATAAFSAADVARAAAYLAGETAFSVADGDKIVARAAAFSAAAAANAARATSRAATHGAAAHGAAAADAAAAASSSEAAQTVIDAATAQASTAAYIADLDFLKDSLFKEWPDLWQNRPPRDWNRQIETLLLILRNLGLNYWADEYRNWLTGRFDQQKLERCLFMPEATIKAGVEAMLVYLQAEKLVNMAEARVIFLGEGEAGKTSLIRQLFGEIIRGDEKATPRVEIRQRREHINETDVRVHYWDFGGQVIMHATHQFFLREKSVYVVVLDIRRCDSLEYWLDHVRVFASGAPTLIVLNKVDLLPTGMAIRSPFDINKIRRRYPFVVDAVFPLSCKTVEGVTAFSSILKEHITESHILRADMPEKWFRINEALAIENRDFIPRDRFDSICRDQDVAGDDITTALRVLDILGTAIHFPTLRHTDVVLNPEWITKAIYFIIWASEKQHLNGDLDVNALKCLFAEARANDELDVAVPDEKCDFLLDLMTEFKLAFRSRKREGLYCVPMLAPTDEPPHDVSREGGLQFIFSLPFLPPGLFYRFVAESGDELADGLIWKSGAIFTDGENRILAEYSDYQRSITFIAHGEDCGAYLTTLRTRLLKILGESYKELEYDSYVMTREGERINWLDMTKRYSKEGASAKVYTERNEYSIVDLLKMFLGVFGDDLKGMIKTEFELMRRQTLIEKNIKIEVNPTTTISPVFYQENKQDANVSVTVCIDLQPLLHLDSDLMMIKELLDDFNKYEKEKAVKHDKEVSQLYRDIERLQADIAEIKKLTETSELEKMPVMRRIKERWEILAERAKQLYYITGMGDKIANAAIWISKIDWDKWVPPGGGQ